MTIQAFAVVALNVAMRGLLVVLVLNTAPVSTFVTAEDVVLEKVVAVGLATVHVLVIVFPPDVSTLVLSSAPVRIAVLVEAVTPVRMLVVGSQSWCSSWFGRRFGRAVDCSR